VDSLVSPEVVVPTSLQESDYTVTDRALREKLTFHHVPFPFLFREGWGPGSVNLYETYENTIKQSVSAREYLRSSRSQRDDMFNALAHCIESNEMVEDELPDNAIIQAALLQAR
jgi:hypothetical protein